MIQLTTISPQALAEVRASGRAIDVLDVRTPVEFRGLHLAFARNVPLDQLDPQAVMEARSGGQDEPLYIVCLSGSRGEKACEQFRRAGFPNVVNVEGGTTACEQAGLPMTRGQATMSLERQVRIVAGSLVVSGVILGWLVHPACTGLSAFVGAGLVFAGITDSCGMGMILARMPWNQCSQDATGCHVP